VLLTLFLFTLFIYYVKIHAMFMEKIGIICEYNPFHNGHIYHLQKIKEMYPDDMIILVMSGSFTMRGEVSLLNKWDKTHIALTYGVNLVIELPTFYSTNSADFFAYAAIKILKELKCNYLVFGSESNDIKLLSILANTELNNSNYDKLVKKYMDMGYNYPTSMSKSLYELTNKVINLPNDLLGLSYIKEIIKQKAKIKPISILRTNNYHDTNINNEISSATSIRNAINNNIDIKKLVPKETYERIIKDNFYNRFFSLLKYKIISDINNLDIYFDVSEGIGNLIKKNIYKAHDYDELISLIKTKRYTYNRLNRILIHILLNMKKKDVNQLKKINYIRVLGFDEIGKKYLKSIKDRTRIPIITNYSNIKDNNLNFELNATFIYNMIINNEELNLQEIKSIPIKK